MDIYNESLALHKKYKGKIEIVSKVSLENKEDLSLVYTPGVAEVSREIARNPENARDYTIKGNSIAIISDGSAILGLGNLGPLAAIPVMEGKAALFKKFGNIDAVPLCINTEDEEEIINIIKALEPSFGGINLEDISAPRCFTIEKRLQAEMNIPVMHDDQHGTAVVVLAGLINSLKLSNKKKEEVKIIINGAGAAGLAITTILLDYGFKNIIICDSQGAIYSGRINLNPEKEKLALLTNLSLQIGSLSEMLRGADIFIGVSKGNLITEIDIKNMNTQPIIFALANPEPEIMPERAKKAGAFIVATGRSDYPNQVNNVLAFPGIFRGALDNRIKQFDNKMFVRAAEALADCVTDLSPEKVIPGVFDSGVAESVAKVIK